MPAEESFTVAGIDATLAQHRNTLVLIIDDLGNNLQRDNAVLDLPGKVNVAVLPHTPWGERLARSAPERGKEVMLHAPMTTLDGTEPGQGALTESQSREQFEHTLAKALASIPNARGVNNHMGSALTQRWEQMNWLMASLRGRQLYFVDSRTSGATVAAEAARYQGLPNLSRRIFLDNEPIAPQIEQQLDTALAIARREGLAVAIGHPHPETISVLQRRIPQLQAEGLHLAWVSEVLGFPQRELARLATRPGLIAAESRDSDETAEERADVLETDLDALVGHELFGLGHGKLPEVENTGS